MFTPLEQFKITPILKIKNNWLDLSLNNSVIFMIISIIIIFIFLFPFFGINTPTKLEPIVPLCSKNKLLNSFENLYKFIESQTVDLIGKNYSKYIPFLFSLFLFILMNNLIGLIPYSFTTTSHISVTLTFSLSIIIAATIIAIKTHGILGFFTLFIPKGLNNGGVKTLIPLIFLIELISYLFRIISLSVRLAANLMSGHTLLKIIANFGLKYTLFKPYLLIVLPLIVVFGILLLEFGVALIQAYVFTLLTTIYIKDVEHLH